MSYLQTAIDYSNDCLTNKISAGKYIKIACNNFLDYLNDNSPYFIDEDELTTLVNFIQSFYLTEVTPPTLTILESWQIWLLANIYCVKRKDNLLKKHRIANISVGRGNGKTQLFALLCIYELIYGTDAQIILAGNTTKTTMEVDFDKIKKLLYQIDPKEKHIKIYYNKIVYKNNKIIVTSNEAKPFDGMAGSVMLIDEMHLFEKNNVYGALRSSMAKRKDNILLIASTAGLNTDTEYYKLCEYSKQVLEKKLNDDSLFSALYYVDDELVKLDDIYNDKALLQANPNLGVSVQKEVLQSELNVAKINENERTSILTKHLNIWANKVNQDCFIHNKFIEKSFDDFDLSTLGNDDIIMGFDGSINDDITALSMLYKKDDIYYFINKYYICSESLTTKKNKERYKEAAKDGYITIIEGNAIDYQYIINDILLINKKNDVRLICFDKYNASEFVKQLDSNGFNLYRVSQLASGLNAPLREIQRLFLLNKIKIQNNPLTKWMFENIKIVQNQTGLIMLDKSSEHNKIDGVAAMVDCLAGYLNSVDFGFNVY